MIDSWQRQVSSVPHACGKKSEVSSLEEGTEKAVTHIQQLHVIAGVIALRENFLSVMKEAAADMMGRKDCQRTCKSVCALGKGHGTKRTRRNDRY